MKITDQLHLSGIAVVSRVSALLLVAVAPCTTRASVSAVSSNAIRLDARDWSRVTAASASPLPSFSSTKPGVFVIIR